MKQSVLASALLLLLAACSNQQELSVSGPTPAPETDAADVQPAPPPADSGVVGAQPSAPDAELEAAIRAAAPDYKADIVSEPSMKSRYAAARADLNSDGNDEVFVYLMGGMFCGTGGCSLLVFSKDMNGYSLLADISISRPPIIVADTQRNGFADFWRMQTGGGGPSEFVQHVYQDGKYIEKSRVPAHTAPMGKEILAANTDFASGTELEPGR
jgi:hypothetical protein